MTLVVLAAGMGSRYGGMKQVDPVGPEGEFIIDYSCHDAVRAGFDHIVFVIKKENLDIFRDTIGKRVEPYVKVSYVFQDIEDLPDGFTVPDGRTKPWGTAHALLACRDVVKDNFATVNADDFYGYDAFRQVADYMEKQPTSGYPMRCCLVGYQLKNTLSDNGSVSRGVCASDRDGKLVSITERTKIFKTAEGAEFEENGQRTFLSGDTVVSMNMFGMTPAVFDYMKEDFPRFLSQLENPLKSEYFIPLVTTNAMQEGKCNIDLLVTEEKWFGVTYADDKPLVKENFRKLTEAGVYTPSLWSDLK